MSTTEMDNRLAAELVGTEPINHPELQRALAGRVADALAAERARILRAATNVVEKLVGAYPIESPAVQAGIWGDFDQWASGQEEGL